MIKSFGNHLLPDEAWAIFSDDERYRYSLHRKIDKKKSKIVWCMLNPSTADAFRLDPTLRKCLQFSKYFGFGMMRVVNLFAFRATNPKELYDTIDPVGGIQNYKIIQGEFETADLIICGWGSQKIINHVNFEIYIKDIRKLLYNKNVKCLGINKDKSPEHPLYIPYDRKLMDFKYD